MWNSQNLPSDVTYPIKPVVKPAAIEIKHDYTADLETLVRKQASETIALRKQGIKQDLGDRWLEALTA